MIECEAYGFDWAKKNPKRSASSNEGLPMTVQKKSNDIFSAVASGHNKSFRMLRSLRYW